MYDTLDPFYFIETFGKFFWIYLIVLVVVRVAICIVIAGYAAQSKRSGTGYFFAALFLSPLLAFIALSLDIFVKLEKLQTIIQVQTKQPVTQAPITTEHPTAQDPSDTEPSVDLSVRQINVNCPSCNKRFQTSDLDLVNCPDCGVLLKIKSS